MSFKFFPKVILIDSDKDKKFGIWEGDERGGQYNDDGTITIFALADDWGNMSLWYFKTIFHEFLHHVADSINFPLLHKIVDNYYVRKMFNF